MQLLSTACHAQSRPPFSVKSFLKERGHLPRLSAAAEKNQIKTELVDMETPDDSSQRGTKRKADNIPLNAQAPKRIKVEHFRRNFLTLHHLLSS